MILNRNIKKYSISVSASVKVAMIKLNTEKTRFLVCVDENNRIRGVVTLGDINRWLVSNSSNLMETALAEVCNRQPIIVSGDTPSVDIESKLLRVPFVPVIDSYDRLIAVAMEADSPQGLSIGGNRIGPDSQSFIIAEIGNNHNGSLDLAKRLVDMAAGCGATCAKFQIRDLEALYLNSGAGDERENLGSQYTLDLLKRFQLSPDDLMKALDYCKDVGIVPLCTAWDETSVARLEDYGVEAYKVASADLTNHSLLRRICRTGKPLICSTGMSHEEEIRESVKYLKALGASYALLHCNSTYPAPFKDINLKYMDRLSELGECEIGYSGHERDIFVSIAAVARGARIIEKHFTLDRSMEGNDHKVSLLPVEFERMVEGIRQVEEAMGNGDARAISQGELLNRVTLAKSVFINQELAEGEIIDKDMLIVRSPGHGLQPNRVNELIGLPAPRNMRAGDVFYPADLAGQKAVPRDYCFKTQWGLPVRHHDYKALAVVTNANLLEFHLSYSDLELKHENFFSHSVSAELIVHAPELFRGDHVLDLTSPDTEYRKHSIDEMRRVIDVAKLLRRNFLNQDKPIGVVTNVGGFSQDEPLSFKEVQRRKLLLSESLEELQDPSIQIWPQTMPPFPWHFGGQRFHNLFVDADEIVEFCSNSNMQVCLDISHSKLACNYQKKSFELFLEKVLPFSAHLHIADSLGIDGEGLQIGDGDIDFYALGTAIEKYNPRITWIPEIWQGHENQGEGFWLALQTLENHGKY